MNPTIRYIVKNQEDFKYLEEQMRIFLLNYEIKAIGFKTLYVRGFQPPDNTTTRIFPSHGTTIKKIKRKPGSLEEAAGKVESFDEEGIWLKLNDKNFEIKYNFQTNY